MKSAQKHLSKFLEDRSKMDLQDHCQHTADDLRLEL